ncbi:hypothetical protein [Butyricimonas synergistica]|uniref:hypothetical protein n=1 Tax=Butyricimonas synergistica TaxID=544644 RepID=UPI00037DDF56|nr:hypothetical protein [Butyricimonas synergistica]
MKKVVVFVGIILLVCAFKELSPFEKQLLGNLTAQLRELQQEKLYLHTDKSVYNVGEKIWFRGYLVHAAGLQPMVYSRYAYVDLVDRRDSVIRRIKVVERDSCFYGQVNIPKDLQQGDYCLRGYTYYMQNQGEDFLFKKKIRVINPEDSKVWTDVTYTKNRENSYTATIRLSDADGEPYDRVLLTYIAGVKKDAYSKKNARTDKEGKFEVKIDTTMKTIEIEFQEGHPFPFKRYIHIPSHLRDFDVQFFPEGGSLLSNNWQKVAFKAIGADGRAVHASGEVYQDSVAIAEIETQHDGMGCFRIPVNPGKEFYAIMRTEDGVEKRFDLPKVSDDGWGVTLVGQDSMLHYRVIKAQNARLPKELYAVIHCRGMLIGSNRVNGLTKGSINMSMIPEGISHIVLMDEEANVYSQRLFFRKFKQRPELKITTNKPTYVSRELVKMEIDFDAPFKGYLDGSFSISVTDDEKVVQDSLEDNILSNLLLTSDLKGYIDNPAYYFNDTTPEIDAHLDLVMMTHGWTRFDISKIAKGEFAVLKFPLEIGQIVSGRVNNFWGKKSKGANIVLISNYGLCRMVETDETGNFVVNGIAFHDSTSFLVQALSAKGRRGVTVRVDEDEFLPPVYDLPYNMQEKKKEEEFYKQHGLNYYYENGEKIYVLDEVQVVRRKIKKSYSFYDNLAYHQLDSAKIAENGVMDITQIIQLLPGVTFEKDDEGEDCFKHFGRKLYILVNDFEEPMDQIRLIPVGALRNISLLDRMQGQIFFGDRGANGVLIISAEPGWTPKPLGRPNVLPFKLLGFQVPDEFYVPKYDVDSVRKDNRYDERSTIYWKPVITIDRENPASVSFYTADTYGKYSVIVEGITSNGIICRKRVPLVLK